MYHRLLGDFKTELLQYKSLQARLKVGNKYLLTMPFYI